MDRKEMKLKFQVLGKTWTMHSRSRKDYKRQNGNDSVAITNMNKRRIDISPDGIDKETIIHELLHAYMAELCIGSADLDNDNLEEIFAELLSKRGHELLKLASSLKKQLTTKRTA